MILAAWQRHSSAIPPPRTGPPTQEEYTGRPYRAVGVLTRVSSRPGKPDVAKLLRASGARLLPGTESSSDQRTPPSLPTAPAAAASMHAEAVLSEAWSTAAANFSPLVRRLLVEGAGAAVAGGAGVAVTGGASAAAGADAGAVAGAVAGAAARRMAEELVRERGATERLGSYRAARAALATDATAALARVPGVLGGAACAALRRAIDAAGEGEIDTVDQPVERAVLVAPLLTTLAAWGVPSRRLAVLRPAGLMGGC